MDATLDILALDILTLDILLDASRLFEGVEFAVLLQESGACSQATAVGKLNFPSCLFSVVIMLLKMAYQSLRDVCVTSDKYIKRKIVVVLSTFSPSMINGHAVSVTQRKRVLISHCSQQSITQHDHGLWSKNKSTEFNSAESVPQKKSTELFTSCLSRQQFSRKRNLLSCLALLQVRHTLNLSNCFEAR